MKPEFVIPSLLSREEMTDAPYFVIGSLSIELIHLINHFPKIKVVEFCQDLIDWSKLKQLRNVEEWVFSGSYQLDEAFFQQLPSIRKVTFHNCENLKNAYFKEFIHRDALESLHLSYCSGIDQDCLKFLPNLKHLKITRCFTFGDEGAITLSRLNNLTTLDLDLTEELTDQGVEALARLPKLKALSLEDCGKVTSFQSQKELQYLALMGANQLDAARLRLSDTLIELTLSSIHLSKMFDQLTKLERLDLWGCHFSPLVKVLSLPQNLSELSLSSGFEKLAGSYPNLKRLNIDSSFIKDDDFFSLKSTPHLEEMDLESCCKLTDSCLKYFSQLQNLKKLNISQCRGFSDLLLLSKCKGLKVLNLSGCELNDASLKEVGALDHLQELDLSKCYQLSDEGAKYLKGLKKLKKLNLCSTSITEKGIFFMSSLESLEELSLDLAGTKFSQASLREFFHVFPKLKQIKFGTFKLKSENFILDIVQLNPRSYRLVSSG